MYSDGIYCKMEKCISDGIYCKMEGSASAAAPKGGVCATGVMNASGEGDVPRARIAICCTIKVQGVSMTWRVLRAKDIVRRGNVT